MKKLFYLIILVLFVCIPTHAQRKVTIIEPESSQEQEGKGLKRKVAIARFTNETQYAKGLFYDKENDPMGKQALDILSAKLASSNKFILL
ncbi:MAG: penicillin-binding protein activator LpoB, partial [Bacteroides sp.]